MTNLIAFTIILSAATAVAGIVWLVWPDARHDERQQCQRCGCGMVNSATGWQCPECRNIVEAERSAL